MIMIINAMSVFLLLFQIMFQLSRHFRSAVKIMDNNNRNQVRSRAVAKARSDAPQQPQAGGRERRESQWQKARGQTLKHAANAAGAVGRWFGVAGDEAALHAMHEEYNRQKTMKRSQKVAGNVSENQLMQVKAIMQESSSEDDEEDIMRVKHMTRDMSVAMAHYQGIWTVQRKEMRKPGWFGGEISGKPRASVTTMAPERRKHTRRRDDTMVRMQLAALPTFTPWFIYIVTLLQALIFIGMMAHAKTKNQIAAFGLQSTITNCTITLPIPTCPTGFDGATLVTGLQRKTEKNFLYGPTTSYLVSIGAKFTLCMRSDSASNVILAKQRSIECGQYPNVCDNPATYQGYSCCGLPGGRKGMAPLDVCTKLNGTWVYGAGQYCVEGNDYIVLRPCCAYKRNVDCMLTTQEECSFINGVWQHTKQLCADTLCLAPICQLLKGGYGITADPVYKNLPNNPNQWFRFFVPIFIHAGIIQAVVLLVVQLYFGCQIERQAGFLRMMIIYFISGFGGYCISGIFASETATVGCDPAVYGLLAVHVVELVQNWQILDHPWWQCLKLTIVVVSSLMIGTLPFIDNWSHVGGFVFGLVSGIVFLPYITFGKWDLTRKRLMLFFAIPSLIVMLIIEFVYFYKVQSIHFCSWCHYIDCVPYTSQIDCGVDN